MNFLTSETVSKKLREKHGVTEREVFECFLNRIGKFLEDTREQHQTTPPTKWFLAKTNAGRLLKIVFIHYKDRQEIVIKSAFEPNQIEIDIYKTITTEE